VATGDEFCHGLDSFRLSTPKESIQKIRYLTMKQEIAYVVLLLIWLESSSALHIGLDDSNKQSIYYTSTTRKCTYPRLVNSVKPDYSLITHAHGESEYPAISRLSAPVEFQIPSGKFSTGRPLSSHQQKRYSTQSLINLGCAFSLNSGFLNGLCLSGVLGRSMPVAAVTGTYTNAAVALFARHQVRRGISALVTVLATPACFMLGSMVNGICNPEGFVPMDELSILQTSPLLLAGAMILLAKSVMNSDIFVNCLCITFAMGLQNSWTSNMLPGNLLRTTHFSGITSDFGTILGQALRGNTANAYKLLTCANLTASFWLGGILSQLAVGPLGFAPSLCYTISALFYFGVWGTWPRHSLGRAVVIYRECVQASIYQQYRTAVAFCNFWWKERLGDNQWNLSWNA